MTRQDAADLLGIGIDATPSQVHSAFRELSGRFHPDGGGKASQFVLLQRARDVLMKPAEPLAPMLDTAPAFWPVLSYPVRLSVAALHHKRLRPKAFRVWLYVVVGLPLVFYVARDFLALLLLPAMLGFLILSVLRSRF